MKIFSKKRQVARGLHVPVEADSVDGPIVQFGDGPAVINFPTESGGWGQVTFERLDSLRICRGEYSPYSGEPASWVCTVDNSTWLKERYTYEKAHYGNQYNFGGDVDEMLAEFSHYLFRFHDEFVEAIAAAIWLEESAEQFDGVSPRLDHPLRDLPESSISERFEAHGITCQVRTNSKPKDELVRDAALCSQNIVQYAAELEGSSSISWTVQAKVRDGYPRSYLRDYFGNAKQVFDGVPDEAKIRPRIEQWLGEVRARRDEMGLD
ncbi:hypothetical protein ABI59_14120 [Acidobacteria bacterium Mor1]|nr:hypothetical protein ABI59_14120 [Acidobacteria bacterium Mor1]